MATLGGFLSVLTAPGVSQAAFLCLGEVLSLLLMGPSISLSGGFLIHSRTALRRAPGRQRAETLLY